MKTGKHSKGKYTVEVNDESKANKILALADQQGVGASSTYHSETETHTVTLDRKLKYTSDMPEWLKTTPEILKYDNGGGVGEKSFYITKGGQKVDSFYLNSLPVKHKWYGDVKDQTLPRDKFNMVEQIAPNQMFPIRRNSWVVFRSEKEAKDYIDNAKREIENDKRFSPYVKKELLKYLNSFKVIEGYGGGGNIQAGYREIMRKHEKTHARKPVSFDDIKDEGESLYVTTENEKAYIDSLPVHTVDKFPVNNPENTTKNYIMLHGKDMYFVDTQGFDYPRYVSRLVKGVKEDEDKIKLNKIEGSNVLYTSFGADKYFMIVKGTQKKYRLLERGLMYSSPNKEYHFDTEKELEGIIRLHESWYAENYFTKKLQFFDNWVNLLYGFKVIDLDDEQGLGQYLRKQFMLKEYSQGGNLTIYTFTDDEIGLIVSMVRRDKNYEGGAAIDRTNYMYLTPDYLLKLAKSQDIKQMTAAGIDLLDDVITKLDKSDYVYNREGRKVKVHIPTKEEEEMSKGGEILHINNLKIKYNKMYEKWQVSTPPPSSRVLEEFSTKERAIEFAKTTFDFTHKRKHSKGGGVNRKKVKKIAKFQLKKLCPVGTKIQSLIFYKTVFSKAEAREWCKIHNFKSTIDEKTRTYRMRQENPRNFKKKSFRTISITTGVKAVIGCPKQS